MNNTIEEERHLAKESSQEGFFCVFQGQNLIRFIISAWPKITQQLVGLTVFNTYATYFCKQVNRCYQAALMLNRSPIRWEQ